MTDIINEAARSLGRRGGQSKSIAKRAAAAANLARARAARRAHQPQPITLDRKAKLTEAELLAIVAKYAPKATEPAEPMRLVDDLEAC
jgi:hypothetical protein